MALVISTSLNPVNVQVFGNWFTFKPGQMKNMEKRIADFLSHDKRFMGFMALPEVCEESPGSPEAPSAIANATVEGRENIKQYLKRQIENLEVHTKAEYEMNKQSVPSTLTAAHLPLYRELAALTAAGADKEDKVLDEISKLKEQINGASAATDSSSPVKGS